MRVPLTSETLKLIEVLKMLLKNITAWIKNIIPDFLKPIHSGGGLIRMMHFKNEVNKFNFMQAMDAGCGEGQYSFYLARLNPSSMITAYELNEQQVEKNKIKANKLKIKNVKFIQKDLTKLNDIEKFDLIVSIDVLEHIQEDKKVIEYFYKALKDNGYIYIHVPGSNKIRYFKKIKNMSKQEDHVRNGYMVDELKQLLMDAGFNITKIGRTFGIWGDLAWELYMLTQRRYLIYLANPLIRLLAWMDVQSSNKKHNNFFIIAIKNEPGGPGGI